MIRRVQLLIEVAIYLWHNTSVARARCVSLDIARSRALFMFKQLQCNPTKCLRPYHVESTNSRLITEVKQHWEGLVLGWVTAWEYLVLQTFLTPCRLFFVHLASPSPASVSQGIIPALNFQMNQTQLQLYGHHQCRMTINIKQSRLHSDDLLAS